MIGAAPHIHELTNVPVISGGEGIQSSIIDGTIQTVQILTGFGVLGVKDPQWTDAANIVLNNLKGLNLTKIIPTVTDYDLGLDIYNQYFFISGQTAAPVSVQPPLPTFTVATRDVYPEFVNSAAAAGLYPTTAVPIPVDLAPTTTLPLTGSGGTGYQSWLGPPTQAVSYTHLTLPTTPYV